MDSIDKRLMDIGNDMKSFSQMNIVLSQYWQDENADRFEREFISGIENKWNEFEREASDGSKALQRLDKQMQELLQELELDSRNI